MNKKLLEVASFIPKSLCFPNSWVGHMPFAFFLVGQLKPKILVELGTHSGNSYFSFCQSVAANKTNTKCYAVDTWQGDEHAGSYSEEIYEKVFQHNEQNYKTFSNLMRMTFDEAVKRFEDGSINLLHIDGLHTYEAVKHDFETWLPKMADGGIVIFHDTQVQERGFGAWRLWSELQQLYSLNVEFNHSNGLGVIQLPELKSSGSCLGWLIPGSLEQKELVDYFASLGDALLQRYDNQAFQNTLANSEEQIGALNDALANSEEQIGALNNALAKSEEQAQSLTQSINEIFASNSWRVTAPLRFFFEKLKTFLIFQQLFSLSKSKGGLLRIARLAINYLRANGVRKFTNKILSLKYENTAREHELKEFAFSANELSFFLKQNNFEFELAQIVDIIVPVYNGYDYLPPLFSSIQTATTTPFRLIIVDDCSSDARVYSLLKTIVPSGFCKEVILEKNNSNNGFIKTVNLAMSMVSSDYFVILNTDVEVPTDWLQRLIQPFILDEKVASTTPFTNSGTICSFPNYLEDNDIFEGCTLKNIDDVFKGVNFEKTNIEIPTGVGFCMGISRQVLEKIGCFDESFGKGYGEENDWCMRAINAGYKNLHVTNLFVYHKHGGSFDSNEKKELLEKNSRLLNAKHPNYEKQVQSLIAEDKLKSLRLLLAYKLLSTHVTVNLYVNHSIGGGATEYLDTRVSNSKCHFKLTFHPELGLFVEAISSSYPSFKIRLQGYSDLLILFETFSFDRVVINNVVTFPDPLALLKSLIEIKLVCDFKVEFLLHDYYAICPSYNLLDWQLNFCNVPEDVTVCKACVSNHASITNCFSLGDIINWRDLWGSFLNECDEIWVFSKSSSDLLLKAYPSMEQKIRFAPHVVSWVRSVKNSGKHEILRIAILGTLTHSKGLFVVNDLASFCTNNGLNLEIHIFGKVANENLNLSKYRNIIVHGRYEKKELSDLIEATCIDLIFIPSIWPETFSYTTVEAVNTGLPLVTFDLGAQAEHCRAYSKGRLAKSFRVGDIVEAIYSLVGMDAVTLKRVPDNRVQIYQIYYEEEQRELLSPVGTPYFNPKSAYSDIWHEFGVFVKAYKEGLVGKNLLTGYLSWAFEKKCFIQISEFKSFIENNPGADVYFINPFPELVTLYSSVWEQGEIYHPGIIKLAQKLLLRAGFKEIDLLKVKNDSSTAAYSNYWVGNNTFWDEYMSFVLPIYEAFNSLSQNERKEFISDSGYHTGVGYMPFIMERMFSTYLSLFSKDFIIKPFVYTDTQAAKVVSSLRKTSFM